MVKPRLAVLYLLFLAFAPGVTRAASIQDDLNGRWRGGAVVVKIPLASSCDGFYNDDDVIGSRVDSKARRRFDAGELAQVERIDVKRGRVDVFLDLTEGVLEEFHDGPFTLYDPRTCKIQLKVPVPDRSDAGAVEKRLAELLELYDSPRAAEASRSWNGRRREPFPEGYEKTLAEHEAWKAARTNAAVQERMDDAIEDAARLADRVRTEPDYSEGFTAGLEKARDLSFGDCPSLLTRSFSPSSGGGGKSSDWRRGYEDGQRLGFDLELLRRLRDCFVPVPPPQTNSRSS
ncbi:MAG TPA: hypothetical protein VEW48_19005 [Thermoanaerobaculia bacterium]|nr:hypothetical protein [Thermoanaerobaculia bacterium]